MKPSTLILGFVLLSGLSGCAHGIMRGSVAMKTSDDEAHVCLGKGEVQPGDRVTVFNNECKPKGSPNPSRAHGVCEKREAGKGTVEEIINEHYSLVKFDSGVEFKEGSTVEKN